MKYNFLNKKDEELIDEKKDNVNENDISESSKKEPQITKDGLVSVKDGKIVITDPLNGGKKAKIKPIEGIILKVNNDRVANIIEVSSTDNINVEFELMNGKRKINIRTSVDKISASVDISYTPTELFKLKDKKEASFLILEKEIKKEIFPQKFTVDELKAELAAKKITYGIIEENINEATTKDEVSNLLIVQGKNVVHDTDDVIEYYFQTSKTNSLEEDSEGSIDYKSIGHVKPVLNGQVLCELIPGTVGEDGIDIYGNVVKKKTGKRLKLTAGENTTIDGNKIITTSDGKAHLNNGKVAVVRIHEVSSDVDIKTGNISFIGDIIIHGEVKDNMKVTAGHGIEIRKNVLDAVISCEGDIKINENAIHSKIIAGGNNVIKIGLVEDLVKLKTSLEELYKDIENIREYNLMNKDIKDGQVLFLLLEKKYKNIPRLCLKILKSGKFISGRLIVLIKVKLLDIAPLNIKHYTEISEIISSLDENSKTLSYEMDDPHNVELNYCQDSQIQCTGSVYIHGKGEYVSNIMANDGIIFTKPNSIARGGIIKATNMIKCGIVGSEVGVSTKLSVSESGHIYAEVAYNNTTLVVGSREHTLDKSFKQVHAYLDQGGELVVDKFVL